MVNISDLATFGTQDAPHVKKLWWFHIAVYVTSIREHCTIRKLKGFSFTTTDIWLDTVKTSQTTYLGNVTVRTLQPTRSKTFSYEF